MSKKLQCQDCGRAEYGEDLYNYDGEILCRYCIVARVYEGSTSCEYVGICNDETFPNKIEQINLLKQQLKETKDKIDLYNKFVSGGTIEEVIDAVWRKREIDKLKKQLADKQNTIDKINKEFVQAVHDWEALCAEKDKEISDLEKKISLMEEQDMIFHNQLAIQELEKVKEQLDKEIIIMSNFYEPKKHLKYLVEIVIDINQRLKELKGE